MAAVALLGDGAEVVPGSVSEEVVDRLVQGQIDAAVLPIENSLHGSVAEHYDLLLHQPIQIVAESLLRIGHNLIAAPGVAIGEIREVISHPVALSQCRRFPEGAPRYASDAVLRHRGQREAPDGRRARGTWRRWRQNWRPQSTERRCWRRGSKIIGRNYTRFHLIRRQGDAGQSGIVEGIPDKMTVAFAVEHRPGTLAASLGYLSAAGADLTRIESRPVPGRPWEYVFYIEFRFREQKIAEDAVQTLGAHCRMVKELGRYKAAESSRQANAVS